MVTCSPLDLEELMDLIELHDRVAVEILRRFLKVYDEWYQLSTEMIYDPELRRKPGTNFAEKVMERDSEGVLKTV